jgi:hypothetical protein
MGGGEGLYMYDMKRKHRCTYTCRHGIMLAYLHFLADYRSYNYVTSTFLLKFNAVRFLLQSPIYPS